MTTMHCCSVLELHHISIAYIRRLKLFTVGILAYDDSHVKLEVARLVKHCSKLTYNFVVTLVN